MGTGGNMDDKLNNNESNNNFEENNNQEERKQLELELTGKSESYENNNTFNKKEFTNIFADILETSKKWFTKQPLSAFSKKLDMQTSLSLLVSHLLISMIIFFLSFNSIVSVMDGLNMINRSGLSFRMILPIFSMHIIYYLLLTTTIMLIAKLIKTSENSFKDSLSLVSIALIPVTALALASLIIGFIIPQLIPVFYIMQFIVYLISLYMGLMVHLGKSEKSLFWIYPTTITIMLILFILIMGSISRAIVTSQVNSINNFNFFNGF